MVLSMHAHITSGNVEHCWRAGATQLGICPRCSGCITFRQRTAFFSWSKTDLPVAVTCVLYFEVAPSNHENWEEVQPRSVTEGCIACCRMEENSLAGQIDRRISRGSMSVWKLISDKKKRVRSRACALPRSTNDDIPKIPLERTTRLAHSSSPINSHA